MDKIIEFFNHPFFIIIGGISTIIAIGGFCYGIYVVFKGILPVWIRLGKSLHNRKIAIYAEENYSSLKSTLVDSGIFKKNNIIQVHNDSIEKGRDYTIMLVYFPDCEDCLENILKTKRDSDALIVYAPRENGSISDEVLKEINLQRNSIIVNFRGRLLNDIVTSMITTVYEKK